MLRLFRLAVPALVLVSGLGAVRAQPVVPFEGIPWIGYNVGESAFLGNAAPTERDPYAMAAADFDGDGDIDVAVGNYDYAAPGGTSGASGFALLFNDGTGHYGAPTHYTVSTKGHFDIETGDFDEDGDLDLVLPHSGRIGSEIGNTVVLYLNDGNGAFTPGGAFTVQTMPLDIAIGDFNADGHLDIVAGSSEFDVSHIAVLLGDGRGGFAPQIPLHMGDILPAHVAVGDFDADGYDDLAVEVYSELVIVMNDGTGGFLAPVMLTEPGLQNPTIVQISPGDYDGDGALDILAGINENEVPGQARELALFRGHGDGTFAEPLLQDVAQFFTSPEALIPADLDGDGDLDIALCEWSGRTGDGIVTLFNDGNGVFSGFHHVPGGQGTQDLAVADVDGDGALDVLASDRMSMAVTVHKNPGDGRLPVLQTRYASGTESTLHLVTGDVDGDGHLDAFASGESFGTHGALIRGNGDGTFGEPVIVTHSTEYGRGVSNARLRDLDGDGDLDLLYNDAHTDFFTGYDFWVALNDGAGRFGEPVEWDQNTCGNGGIEATDLDNDGDLDVINTEELGCAGGGNTANKLYINLNNGDATFQPPTVVLIDTGPHAIEAGDFNEDGNMDLVTTHYMPYGYRDYLNVHLGNGDGTLQEEVVYQVGRGPRFLVVRDLDGDGHLDLATANSSNENSGRETLTVLYGTGDGAFVDRTDYYAPYSPDLQGVSGLEAGDVDGDGDLDLLMATVANGLALYVNDGARGFSFPYRLGAYWGPWSPVYTDLDGDAVGDVLMLTSMPPSGLGRELAVLPGRTGSIPTDTDPGRTPVADLPSGYVLSAVYPNPFNPSAQLTLEVAQSQNVTVAVFDALGRRVALLQDGALPSGAVHTFTVDGAGLPSGVYVVRALGETFQDGRRVTLLK